LMLPCCEGSCKSPVPGTRVLSPIEWSFTLTLSF
jgi:hypothetical protein